MFAFPTQGRKGIDRLPYVDSTFKRQYNRRFLLFQQREVSVFFLLDRTACTGYTEKQKNVSKMRNKKAEAEEMKKKYERVKAETREIATDAVRTSVEYVSRSSTADVEDVYDFTWMSEVE